MSAVRLREHRCALIWCSYGGGDDEGKTPQEKQAGVPGKKKKKNHFQTSGVRSADKHRLSGSGAGG